MPAEDFKQEMTNQRDAIALLVANAVQVKAAVVAADAQEGQDKGEMIGNIVIAYRHLEDAAMRFGKAIQASAGGVSPLGGPNTPGAGQGASAGGGTAGIPKFDPKAE